MIAALVYVVLGFIEAILGLRFVFLLLGANPNSQFVHTVYVWSGPLAAPFADIFGQHPVITGPGVVTHSIFDWTSLIALLVIGIVGGIIARVLASL